LSFQQVPPSASPRAAFGAVFDWQNFAEGVKRFTPPRPAAEYILLVYAGNFVAWEAAMQRFNGGTSNLAGRGSALAWCPVKANLRSFVIGAAAAIIALLREWREREQQRRGLSVLGARDLADMRVPTSLVADELRRWPWQPPSPQWQHLEAEREAAHNGAGRQAP
jgi:uncharacterized protein YjiS (DUF1127 family)